MKRSTLCILTLLLVTGFVFADQPLATTAPANPLIGRWQLLSLGKRKMPENIKCFWTFDKSDVVVTLNSDVATKSQYSLRKDGEHDVISMCEDGKKEPNRVGWYELMDGKLRIQVTLLTGKPPTQWNEDEVMLFQPAVPK